MLETLITSRTRLKLLLKFFLNGANTAYLRSLETEFGESSNAIRVELNRFEEAGLLISFALGNKKIYQANQKHSLFKELHNILIKVVGIDEIIEKVLIRAGDLKLAYVTGDFAKGIDSNVIDLLLVGNNLDKNYIYGLSERVEGFIKRKIRLLIISPEESSAFLVDNNSLLIWEAES